jgi:hypothetical protein
MIVAAIAGIIALTLILMIGFVGWLHHLDEGRKLAGHPRAKALEKRVAYSEQAALRRIGELEVRIAELERWSRGA